MFILDDYQSDMSYQMKDKRSSSSDQQRSRKYKCTQKRGRVKYMDTKVTANNQRLNNGFCEKKFSSMFLSGTFTKAVMYIMLIT